MVHGVRALPGLGGYELDELGCGVGWCRCAWGRTVILVCVCVCVFDGLSLLNLDLKLERMLTDFDGRTGSHSIDWYELVTGYWWFSLPVAGAAGLMLVMAQEQATGFSEVD